MGSSETRPSDRLEYEAVIPAEDAARYFERLAQGIREHLMVVESQDAAVALDVSSSVRIELEVSASRGESSIELEVSWYPQEPASEPDAPSRSDLRVMPGDTGDRLNYEAYANRRDERTGTQSGQLPLPEPPPAVEPGDADVRNHPPELGDLAADDVREADVEASLGEYPEPDDVFAENAEVAFESRAERAQPDTFMTTAEGELRDASDLAPDTAIVEPLVEADESMGEASVGGAASSPIIEDEPIDPATARVDDDPPAGGGRTKAGAPFSEVTPEEFEEQP